MGVVWVEFFSSLIQSTCRLRCGHLADYHFNFGYEFYSGFSCTDLYFVDQRLIRDQVKNPGRLFILQPCGLWSLWGCGALERESTFSDGLWRYDSY